MTEYVPQTYVSLAAHDIAQIKAQFSRAATAYAVQIDATNANGRKVVDFTLFMSDADLAADLAAAINGVFTARAKQAA